MSEYKIVISRRRYRSLMRELENRGAGRRESGAFLLTAATRPPLRTGRVITGIAYYDDVDPGSLTGGITMHDVGFSRLNTIARETSRTVAADIHTHPSDYVRQSSIDEANPMLAFAGHIALIAPRYAQGTPPPRTLGAHRYLGRGKWKSYFGAEVDHALLVCSGFRILLERLRSNWKGRDHG